MTEEEKEHTCHSTAHQGPRSHSQPKKNLFLAGKPRPGYSRLLAGWLVASPCSGQLPQPPKGRSHGGWHCCPQALRTHPSRDALWLPFHQNPKARGSPEAFSPRMSFALGPQTPTHHLPSALSRPEAPHSPGRGGGQAALLMPYSPDTKAGLCIRGSPGLSPRELRAQGVWLEEL